MDTQWIKLIAVPVNQTLISHMLGLHLTYWANQTALIIILISIEIQSIPQFVLIFKSETQKSLPRRLEKKSIPPQLLYGNALFGQQDP